MFDIQVRRWIDPVLQRIAVRLAAAGIRANSITWIGFSIGIVGAVLVSQSYFVAAFFCIVVNRICDGLDGCVARVTHKSDIGCFLDIALDMVFYSSIPFAFALADQRNALAASYLLFSFFGTGCSFLAYAVISANRGKRHDAAGKKSFFYSTGLIEGTETALYLLVVCLFPSNFAISAWIMGSLCWVTTSARIAMAMQEFRD